MEVQTKTTSTFGEVISSEALVVISGGLGPATLERQWFSASVEASQR